jgi:hypothetical protein
MDDDIPLSGLSTPEEIARAQAWLDGVLEARRRLKDFRSFYASLSPAQQAAVRNFSVSTWPPDEIKGW